MLSKALVVRDNSRRLKATGTEDSRRAGGDGEVDGASERKRLLNHMDEDDFKRVWLKLDGRGGGGGEVEMVE